MFTVEIVKAVVNKFTVPLGSSQLTVSHNQSVEKVLPVAKDPMYFVPSLLMECPRIIVPEYCPVLPVVLCCLQM